MTFLEGVPFLGPILAQYALTYIAILLASLGGSLSEPIPLDARAVGENPEAADAAGVNVYRSAISPLRWAVGDGDR